MKDKHLWAAYKTTEYRSIDPQKTIAILPTAAIEQHGPHLPVGVDTMINQGMLEATGLSHEEYASNLDKAIQNTTPDTAALAILKAVQKNARSVIVGNDAKLLSFIRRLIGARYQKLLTARIKRQRQKAQGQPS